MLFRSLRVDRVRVEVPVPEDAREKKGGEVDADIAVPQRCSETIGPQCLSPVFTNAVNGTVEVSPDPQLANRRRESAREKLALIASADSQVGKGGACPEKDVEEVHHAAGTVQVDLDGEGAK